MDLTLTPAQLELQARARAFVRDESCSHARPSSRRAGGRVPRDWGDPIRRAAIEARLHGGSLPVAVGGQGWSVVEQVARPRAARPVDRRAVVVHPGRLQRPASTPTPSSAGAISSRRCAASAPGATRSPRTAPARTRGRCGRPPSATPPTGDYLLNGEKWFVTGPDDTDFMIFHASSSTATTAPADALPRRLRHAGRRIQHDPDYTHTFADRHPQFVLDDVRVPAVGGPRRRRAGRRADQRVVRRGADPHRGALRRGDGAAADAGASRGRPSGSSSASGSTTSRACRFPLADSAADASAARLLTRECAWLADTGADPKVVHAKASLAKLFASEAAWRCADRVVQVFGGRGYMREFAAERFLRELRVDRIWEGTSEIQRMIIARALEKRGVGRVVG